MITTRKALVTLVLAAGSVVVGGLLYGAILDSRLAHAQSQAAEARAQLQSTSDPLIATTFRNIAKAISPAVVDIQVTKEVSLAINRGQLPDGPRLRQFFDRGNGNWDSQEGELPEGLFPGFPRNQEEFRSQGNGSGVIVEIDGDTAYVVTNNHVAAGASEITVTLHDGRKIRNATLVGSDQKADIAVLKIKAERVVAAPWGDSDVIEAGDLVLAFGSPFGYVGSMTQGIVSAKNRQIGVLGLYGQENFLQVDAAINPGNSGGPLVNLKGEVIGINTAIASRDGGFNGLGFAVPSNQAKNIYDALRKDGRVIRGYLGVAIRDVSDMEPEELESVGFKGNSGALIQQVNRGQPSDGKLKDGDVVIAVDGQPVNNTLQLRSRVAALRPGTEVNLTVVREGKEEKVTVKLGELPDEDATNTSVARQPVPQSVGELGITLVNPTSAQRKAAGIEEMTPGVLVTSVRPNSTAGRSGLRQGDLITHVDGKPVANVDEASAALRSMEKSKTVRLSITNSDGTRMIFLREK